MEISREAATAKGPAETFTGDVWVDPITRGLPPSQLNVAAVRFAPGARSAWHSHDGGQTLYVTEGRGLVQVRGQQITELSPGDVVFAPDGEEHWHGASPDHFMTHLSITEGAPHCTSRPVTVLPMIMRWISDVPSKIVKLVDLRAVSAGRCPVEGSLVSTNPARIASSLDAR